MGFGQPTFLVYLHNISLPGRCLQHCPKVPFQEASYPDKWQFLLWSQFKSLVSEPHSSAAVKPLLLLFAMLETCYKCTALSLPLSCLDSCCVVIPGSLTYTAIFGRSQAGCVQQPPKPHSFFQPFDCRSSPNNKVIIKHEINKHSFRPGQKNKIMEKSVVALKCKILRAHENKQVLDRKHQWPWAHRDLSSSPDACSWWCPVKLGAREAVLSHTGLSSFVFLLPTQVMCCASWRFLTWLSSSTLVEAVWFPSPSPVQGIGWSWGGSELFCETWVSAVPAEDSLLPTFSSPPFFYVNWGC